MKKIKGLLSCLLLCLLVGGCNDEVIIDTFADVSNGSTALNSSKDDVLTVGEVYNYIRETGDSYISEIMMKKIMESRIDFADSEIVDLYKKYLNEEFKTRFVDSGSYNYDGEFNEDLLCKYLRSEGYNVECEAKGTNVYLDNNYFKYDYTDYIEKELNYDIYLKMLKVQYIIEEKPALINKNNGRFIEYYSIDRSSTTDVETRESLKEQLKNIRESQLSNDKVSLEDIAEERKSKDLAEIDKELEKISTSSDDTFKYLAKYTTCGSKRCTLEQGEEYQKKLIDEKEYYKKEVIIGSNTTILYEGAREILFGNNVGQYLYSGLNDGKLYLMSSAYENDGSEPNIDDIILFDGSSTYYVAVVRVIDATSSFADQALIAEMLLDSVLEADVLEYYFNEVVDLEIYDSQIKEYFVSKYGEY